MAEPWESAPIVSAPSSAAPWESAPIVSRGPRQIPGGDAIPAPARPAPSLGDKIVGGIQGALDVVQHVTEGLTGMAGSAAGALGGIAGAVQTKLTGGVQPQGDPLGEAADQGAQTAIGGLRSAGNAVAHAGPLSLLAGAGRAMSTPGSQSVAEDVSAGGEDLLRQADPYVGFALSAPLRAPANVAARGAGRIDQGLNAAQGAASKVGDAVAAAPGKVATRIIAKTVGAAADPELLRTARIAADKFPDIQIPPDRLALKGSSTSASTAQKLGDLPGAGGDAHELSNNIAISGHAIRLVNPADTAGRLTPAALETGLNLAGKDIRQGYLDAGPVSAGALQNAVKGELGSVARTGSDEAKRMVSGQVEELFANVDESGHVPPAALHEWDSRLGQEIRQTGDAVLARRMSDLQSAVRDQIASQLSDEGKTALTDARRRYAYGIELEPIARSPGTVNSGIIKDPSVLLRAVTDNRSGKTFTARGQGGDLGDLAKVADLVTTPKGPAEGAAAALHAAGNLVGGATVVAPLLGRAYNKRGPAVTRMLAERDRPPPAAPPEAPPETPAPLQLGYDPGASGSGGVVDPNPLPVTPEGQAVPPGAVQAREDLGVSQRNAGGTGAPPLATSYADYDMNAPEFQPPAAPVGAAAAPSELNAVGDNARLLSPGDSHANTAINPSFPDAIAEPDTARVMTAGRPGEVAATDSANAAMNEPGAVEARRAQGAAKADAEKTAADKAAAAEAAKPKPTADEARRLGEIDTALEQTKSEIVRDALTKARAKVEREMGARDTVEKAKAAAGELRASAAGMTDKATRDALIARADKLDPPPKPKPEKPKETPLPRIEYETSAEWRKAHGLGDENAAAAVQLREALDFDPEGAAAAAQKYNIDHKARDAAVAKILEKRDATERNGAPGGGEGAAAKGGEPSEPAGAPGTQPRGDGNAAPAAGGQGDQQGGQAAADPVAEAADRARFDIAHPRDHTGQFVAPDAPRNLMGEWRAARQRFVDAVKDGKDDEASMHSKHMNDLATEISKTEEPK